VFIKSLFKTSLALTTPIVGERCFKWHYFCGRINMVVEKLKLTKQILEHYPITRGDGHGDFLNQVAFTLFGFGHIDFNTFSVESWTRARRKVMELYPHLDNRTGKTETAVDQVRREVA